MSKRLEAERLMREDAKLLDDSNKEHGNQQKQALLRKCKNFLHHTEKKQEVLGKYLRLRGHQNVNEVHGLRCLIHCQLGRIDFAF